MDNRKTVTSALFKKRQPDFQLIGSRNESKSLLKEIGRFSPTEGERFGGHAGALGPQLKASSRMEGQPKKYYLAAHHATEYFVMEVLCRIGLNTPKARLSFRKETSFIDDKTELIRTLVATESIEGYIPMTAFLNLEYYTFTPNDIPKELIAYNKQYQLNIKNQVVVDLITNQKYKISGNLFAANLGAILIEDEDFQPEGLNLGLARRGDRFFAFLIDKDMAKIGGHDFQTITNKLSLNTFGRVFSRVTEDQKLAILNEIANMIEEDEFQKIFFNSRIMSTLTSGMLFEEKELEKLANNLESTAKSILSHFIDDKPEILAEFKAREELRRQLADSVIECIAFADEVDKEALSAIIIEDLRAPYYRHYLTNLDYITKPDLHNKKLITLIANDQIAELNALGISASAKIFSQSASVIDSAEQYSMWTTQPSVTKQHIQDALSYLNRIQSNKKEKRLVGMNALRTLDSSYLIQKIEPVKDGENTFKIIAESPYGGMQPVEITVSGKKLLEFAEKQKKHEAVVLNETNHHPRKQ
ncbi:hypothetical protein [Aquicella lusitana]|uniref:Uncharacterized protein n=1 Tax=Aquicella lusitana TaxID=254246 RepID=A0A370G818_9COXI|nr:hypothetical protein [Aquicella lusitana]RDI39069.1 hypothetical protein C8D86_12925 [Aquicella lusitana]VVC73676.1 hypothetical protein AQULUS_14230 [Aquicella lusitana]